MVELPKTFGCVLHMYVECNRKGISALRLAGILVQCSAHTSAYVRLALSSALCIFSCSVQKARRCSWTCSHDSTTHTTAAADKTERASKQHTAVLVRKAMLHSEPC